MSAVTTSSFRPRDVALLCLLALIWGNSFLFIKVAVDAIAPSWLVTLRMAIGATLLLPFAARSGQAHPKTARELGTLAFIGCCGVGLPWTLQAWAQQSLDSGLVAVLNACTPLATLLVAVLVGQERLYLNRLFGIGLAVGGTLLVVGGEVRAGSSSMALAAAVLATLGYAIAAVTTRARVSGRMPTRWAASLQLVAGAALLGPVSFASHGPLQLSFDPWVLTCVVALGALGTGFAFLLFFGLIERVGATNTSMVTYLVPVVAMISGATFRGERFGLNVVLGAATMIVGVWLAQRAPGSRA